MLVSCNTAGFSMVGMSVPRGLVGGTPSITTASHSSLGSMPAFNAALARSFSRPTQNTTSRAAAACTRSPSLTASLHRAERSALPSVFPGFAPGFLFGRFSSMPPM